jgi:3-hydroxyacyl-[acyl-carrier-protein] dehydratase
MLFVHKILSLEAGMRATGEWRPAEHAWLTSNSESTKMLFTLPLEALAQLGACAVFAVDRYRGRTPVLAGVKGVEFPHQINLDDTVDLSVEIISLGSRFGNARGSAKVDSRIVCQGEFSFVVI